MSNQSQLVYDTTYQLQLTVLLSLYRYLRYCMILDLVFVKREGLVIPLVKAGTPRKLIERLVPEKYPGRASITIIFDIYTS